VAECLRSELKPRRPRGNVGSSPTAPKYLALSQSVEEAGREPVQSVFESRERDHSGAWRNAYAIGSDPIARKGLQVQVLPRRPFDYFEPLVLIVRMRHPRISDKDFAAVVAQSTSLAQVLRSTRKTVTGGAYQWARRRIEKLNLSTSHFTGQAWSRGQILRKSPKAANPTFFSRSKILRRMRLDGVPYECSVCRISEWNGKKLPLHIDHTDGDRSNNEPDNVRLICPNCHSQCDTSTSSRSTSYELWSRPVLDEKAPDEESEDPVPFCMTEARKEAYAKRRTTLRPTLDVLLCEVEELGFSAVGRKYGVSDNAIRKWIKHYQNHGSIDR
jgi:hypothetical protein